MKNHSNLFIAAFFAVLSILAMPLGFASAACLGIIAGLFLMAHVQDTRQRVTPLANTFWAQLSGHSINLPRKLSDSALAVRGLLVKAGSDAQHVAVCGANNVPLAVVDDDTIAIGNEVNPLLLGRGNTKILVVTEAVAIGDALYTAAGGKVSKLSAVAGTYYLVGYALTATSAADQHVEVNDKVPHKVVVA